MANDFFRSRYSTPSIYTQLMQSREAHERTQQELKKALDQCISLEAEVARLERELSRHV